MTLNYATMPADRQFRTQAQKILWQNPVWQVGAHHEGSAFYYTIRMDAEVMHQMGFKVNDLKLFLQDLPVTVPAVLQAIHVWETEIGWLDPSKGLDPRRAGMSLGQLLSQMMTFMEMLIQTSRHPEAQMKALQWLTELKTKYPNNLPSPQAWQLSDLALGDVSLPQQAVPTKKQPPKTPFDPSVFRQNELNAETPAEWQQRESFLQQVLDHYAQT